MSPLVGVLILVLLGLLGARSAFDPTRAPLGPRLLLATGSHFVLVGVLLGPVLGLLTYEVIGRLEPFMALGLGWIGLLFGLQLDRRQIRQFPPAFLVFTILQAAVAFVAFSAVALLAFRLTGPNDPLGPAAVLAAAATAAVSTPGGVALISRTFRVRGPLTRLLFFAASLDALVGIVALQITYAVFHPSAAAVASLGWGVWMGAAVAAGVIFAVFFLWLTRPKPERDELTLFLLGLVMFEAGTALYLGISPLFVTMITGMVVANMSPSRRRVYSILQSWEKPVYVVVLILAGALISFADWVTLPLALGYAILRAGAKYAGGAVGARFVPIDFSVPLDVGGGLIAQGGISLAMGLSATLTYGAIAGSAGVAVRVVIGAVVIGVAASELVAPFVTRDLLRRAGEITPGLETALAQEAE